MTADATGGENEAIPITQTLAALRIAFSELLEPHEPGMRLAIARGLVVFVEDGMATDYWAGSPSGEPVCIGGFNTWRWEEFAETFPVPVEPEMSNGKL